MTMSDRKKTRAERNEELRAIGEAHHRWHNAINRYRENDFGKKRFMYEGKNAASEVERLPMLFKQEREGTLTKIHKQCSMTPAVPVEDNHLTCCLGVECRKCPQLIALDVLPPDESDRAKAWTCVAHILGNEQKCDTSEGYILTTDDRMFWSRVYENMSIGLDDQEPEPDLDERPDGCVCKAEIGDEPLCEMHGEPIEEEELPEGVTKAALCDQCHSAEAEGLDEDGDCLCSACALGLKDEA